jgi:hypothetical protein
MSAVRRRSVNKSAKVVLIWRGRGKEPNPAAPLARGTPEILSPAIPWPRFHPTQLFVVVRASCAQYNIQLLRLF